LARESQHFVPLPVIRPERAVLTGEAGLIACLAQAARQAGLGRTRAEIRKAVEAGAASAASLLQEIAAARRGGDESKAKAPTLILPIDQAEELFQAEGGEEARKFLDLLRDLVSRDDTPLIVVFTIRSDSYERLQTAESLQGLRPHLLSLPPMPKGAYAEVIKGPARRLEGTKRALKIEEPLVDALLADIEAGGAKDALPLLAFTLERLYVEQGGDGDLRLVEYEELGRVKGSIEAAVERALKAADADPKIPRDRDARLALLRRGLIPWLAGIDPETGSPRRRIARLSEIPAESRPLIDLLVEQRLLSTDVSKETGEVTIEPVHEALLRQWGLLQGWLAEDAGLLGVLDGIKRASRDWAANKKDAAWLTHSGERLKAAENLTGRPDLSGHLEPTDRDYLSGCRAAERVAAGRKRRVQAVMGALVLLVAAAGVALLNYAYLKEQYYWLVAMGPTVLTPDQEHTLKPGDPFKDCKRGCPQMVVIPEGSFTIGSPEGQGHDDEHPQHEVTIAKPLAVGKYEVTFAEWDACVAAGACQKSSDGGFGRGPRPVINVNWSDAEQYVTWLSKLTGRAYRLLSEAEWEYAARAGTRTLFSFGDDDAALGDYGWYSENSPNRTRPVGERKPNAFGLYDMHGNVWEWGQDCYHHSHEGAPIDGTARTTGDCGFRIIRGGGIGDVPEALRSAARRGTLTDYRVTDLGFRVARTLDQ
jgi:formylglycine-generating enzyme required for sulfatase activity